MTRIAAYVSAFEERRRPEVEFDRPYWLAHCEGYRVEGSAGRVGIVEEVIPAAGDRPGLLAVRGGMLGRRLLLIPTTDVTLIVPRALRVLLNGAEEQAR